MLPPLPPAPPIDPVEELDASALDVDPAPPVAPELALDDVTDPEVALVDDPEDEDEEEDDDDDDASVPSLLHAATRDSEPKARSVVSRIAAQRTRTSCAET